jgi:hypothetical protein
MAPSRNPGASLKDGAMRLPTRYSDHKPDEIMFHRPSCAVVLALAALAVLMLVLASFSSERVAAPAQRGASKSVAAKAASGVERPSPAPRGLPLTQGRLDR